MQVTGLRGETIKTVEKIENFGFTNYPPVDGNTENITLYLNGNRDFGLSLASHNRDLRPTDLEEGETRVYSKDSNESNQNYITLKPTNNEILIKNADNQSITIKNDSIIIEDAVNGNKIEMKSGEMQITGNTNIKMNGATEAFVKGTTAKPEMDKDQNLMNVLQTSINAWVPVPNDGGAALKTALTAWLLLPQANYANILSNTIKGE